jgi:hypothetical protein
MRPPLGPQPLHHVAVSMSMEGIEGWTALALFLQHPDGSIELFRPLLKYVKAHPTRQKSWQDTAAQAIGLLWDYGIATKAGRPDRSARDLFRDFAFARQGNGLHRRDGRDRPLLALDLLRTM